MTGLQETKLTLKDAVWFVSLMVTIAIGIWKFSAQQAKTESRLHSIEEKALANKQELDDHNLDLVDYKLEEIDKKLDKIMDKLGID